MKNQQLLIKTDKYLIVHSTEIAILFLEGVKLLRRQYFVLKKRGYTSVYYCRTLNVECQEFYDIYNFLSWTYSHFSVYLSVLDLIYVLPGRKHPRIVVDGFEFNVHQRKQNQTRWRCMYERTKCSVVLYTFGNTVIVRRTHNHSSNWDEKSNKNGVFKRVNIIRE